MSVPKRLKIKSSDDLREMLLDTIEQVRTGALPVAEARTIATLSTTILHSKKLDLDALRFLAANEGLKESATKMLNLVSA